MSIIEMGGNNQLKINQYHWENILGLSLNEGYFVTGEISGNTFLPKATFENYKDAEDCMKSKGYKAIEQITTVDNNGIFSIDSLSGARSV